MHASYLAASTDRSTAAVGRTRRTCSALAPWIRRAPAADNPTQLWSVMCDVHRVCFAVLSVRRFLILIVAQQQVCTGVRHSSKKLPGMI